MEYVTKNFQIIHLSQIFELKSQIDGLSIEQNDNKLDKIEDVETSGDWFTILLKYKETEFEIYGGSDLIINGYSEHNGNDISELIELIEDHTEVSIIDEMNDEFHELYEGLSEFSESRLFDNIREYRKKYS